MNSVQLLGTICRGPEFKFTPSNTAVCNFTIVINKKYKSGDGEMVETATFIECAAWKRAAENINKYFHTGGKIAVTGELSQDKWTDRESGQERSKLKVTVFSFDFCDGKPKSLKRDDESQPKPQKTIDYAATGGHVAIDEDQIPF